MRDTPTGLEELRPRRKRKDACGRCHDGGILCSSPDVPVLMYGKLGAGARICGSIRHKSRYYGGELRKFPHFRR
jgi:hypothetical protein